MAYPSAAPVESSSTEIEKLPSSSRWRYSGRMATLTS
jgi:hypothetical protein